MDKKPDRPVLEHFRVHLMMRFHGTKNYIDATKFAATLGLFFVFRDEADPLFSHTSHSSNCL